MRDLPELVEPLCKHDPIVDSALVGLKARDLDSRRLTLSQRVPDLMKALRLDELLLITSEGEIFGAGHSNGLTGKVDKKLAARVQAGGASARLATGEPPLAVEATVRGARREQQAAVGGLYAARHFDPMLETIADAHGVRLSLASPAPPATTW